MDYKEKIKLIENELSELKKHLDLQLSRFDESGESFNIVMDSIEEKSTGNLKPAIKLLRKNFLQLIEGYRIESDMIRKMSVEASNLLNVKIDELEKNVIEYFDIYEGYPNLSIEALSKIPAKSSKIRLHGLSLVEKIELSRLCIKGTLDRIRD